MKKGIRFKLLLVLLSFIVLYGFTTILNFLYNRKKDKVNEFNNTVRNVETLLLKDVNAINEFFIEELNNSLFFKTGYSLYIEEHKVYISSINNMINILLGSGSIKQFQLKGPILEISSKINNYEETFDSVIAILQEPKNHTAGKFEREETEEQIKILKQEIDDQKTWILDKISAISKSTLDRKIYISSKLRYIFEMSAFTVLVIGIIVSIFLSKQSTRRLVFLSEAISKFVKSNFSSNEKMDVKVRNDEIGQLIKNFVILRKEVWEQINFLEENIRKRTHQILLQKEKIEEQNDEILAQRDEVIHKNELIEKQNRKILDSIQYAKTIQEAFLPEKRMMKKVFEEHFVIWKPKDLVSGDFYWFKNFKEESKSILAVADCTGHGVPGGFMSMLGNALLNEVILRKENCNAAIILDLLRKRLIETLHGDGNMVKSNDGMDIALVIFDHQKNILQFAGANRPLYIISDGVIQKIRGDKMPIGRHIKKDIPFTYQNFYLTADESIYLLSDGFVDQYGDRDKRNFRSNQLRTLLLQHYDKPMELQGRIYSAVFEDWKGSLEQTDDVVFIGIRPNWKNDLIDETTKEKYSIIYQSI